MRLDSLVQFLDDYLRISAEVADAPEALNGLQVSNSGEVNRLAAAVDLCEATVRQAAEHVAPPGEAPHIGLRLLAHGVGIQRRRAGVSRGVAGERE